MTVTREEAESALRDMDAARSQSQELYGYREASPHLLVWGVLWIVAAALIMLTPFNAGLVWLTIDSIGIVASGYICMTAVRRYGSANGVAYGLRYGATAVAFAVFVSMALAIFAPVSGAQVLTFIVMLISVIYVVMGVWLGLRYAAVGVTVGMFAVGAFFFMPTYLTLIASGLGGGALILASLWLRRA